MRALFWLTKWFPQVELGQAEQGLPIGKDTVGVTLCEQPFCAFLNFEIWRLFRSLADLYLAVASSSSCVRWTALRQVRERMSLDETTQDLEAILDLRRLTVPKRATAVSTIVL